MKLVVHRAVRSPGEEEEVIDMGSAEAAAQVEKLFSNEYMMVSVENEIVRDPKELNIRLRDLQSASSTPLERVRVDIFAPMGGG